MKIRVGSDTTVLGTATAVPGQSSILFEGPHKEQVADLVGFYERSHGPDPDAGGLLKFVTQRLNGRTWAEEVPDEYKVDSGMPTDNVIKPVGRLSPLLNMFCATGKGGGVDPSCGHHGGHDHPDFHHPVVDKGAKDTQSAYKKADGSYTPERQKLHQEIVGEHLAGKLPVDKPVAYVMGGGTASGKSSILGSGGVEIPKNTVVIDPDHIKGKIPEYQKMQKNKDVRAAAFVHEESSDVSKDVMKTAAKGGFNINLDGTGDSGYDALKRKVDMMRSGGHKIVAHYVTVDTHTAIERSDKRGEKTGRFVPHEVIKQVHASVSKVVPQALANGLFDEFSLWDTNGPASKKIVSAQGKNVTVHDQKAWDRFIEKAYPGISAKSVLHLSPEEFAIRYPGGYKASGSRMDSTKPHPGSVHKVGKVVPVDTVGNPSLT